MSDNEGAQDAARPRAEITGTQPARKRRRGSRGGRNRSKPRADATPKEQASGASASSSASAGSTGDDRASSEKVAPVEPAPPTAQGRVAPAGAPAKPKIGDTIPAPAPATTETGGRSGSGRRRRGGRGRSQGGANQQKEQEQATGQQKEQKEQSDRARGRQSKQAQGQDKQAESKQVPPKGDQQKDRSDRSGRSDRAKADARSDDGGAEGNGSGRRRRRRRRGKGGDGDQNQPVEAAVPSTSTKLDEKAFAKRKGRERKGKPVGRYMMCVHVSEKAAQIAVLEGRSMIEHYVSRPQDDISQIHGNIYMGRVQNVLPGMEAAFVDIGTPKNAVLYRGDVQYDRDEVEHAGPPRIEKMLRAGQNILCQVTKNPIGAKGARLTQEVSLPGRHVVLIPNSSTYGISKRLPDDERKRLRQLLDRVKPKEHGLIVRTAAEGATSEEIENDVRRLVQQWKQIDGLAKRSKSPALLYREPDMAVRVIREEFNKDYRGVVIDDRKLYESVRDYVASINPTLADRVEYYDPEAEKLPLFERHHVHEQLHRALDRKVWLPSGGSLIIEHTEALTVIDVNTGKNVGRSSLEETVFKNNLEAAVEIARQLRLRDIGGIIVIDYIDMEKRDNRDEVVRVFREALARDKTRTQVFEISELGLCEMTRKRIGEGLLESYTTTCPMCEGRGLLFDRELLPE